MQCARISNVQTCSPFPFSIVKDPWMPLCVRKKSIIPIFRTQAARMPKLSYVLWLAYARWEYRASVAMQISWVRKGENTAPGRFWAQGCSAGLFLPFVGIQDFFRTFNLVQPFLVSQHWLGFYIFFKEVLKHVMLPQLAIVFIKLCESLQLIGIVWPKYLDKSKKLAKYLGFVGCGIPRAFEWCPICNLISINCIPQTVQFCPLF